MNHSRYLSITSAIPLVFVLSACGGGAGGPGGVGGQTTGFTSSQVLTAYKSTEAKDDTKKIADAQEDGIEGYGVATDDAAKSAVASTAGTYVIGKVQKNGDDKLTITVGGKEYKLSGGKSGNTGQLDLAYTAYGNTAHSSADGGGGDTNPNNGAYVLNAKYTSLAAFIKGGGTWSEIGHEDDEWNIPDMEGYGMIVTGLQTPKANMPTETAKNKGEYYYASIDSYGSGNFGASGSFDMTADFGNDTLTGYARVIGGIGDPDDPDHTEFNGTIDGNQFHGTTKDIADHTKVDYSGMTGTFAGGFYGPNAEEIAGVGTGTAKPENFLDPAADVSMAFVGRKKDTP
jgi:hypothetical protein